GEAVRRAALTAAATIAAALAMAAPALATQVPLEFLGSGRYQYTDDQGVVRWVTSDQLLHLQKIGEAGVNNVGGPSDWIIDPASERGVSARQVTDYVERIGTGGASGTDYAATSPAAQATYEAEQAAQAAGGAGTALAGESVELAATTGASAWLAAAVPAAQVALPVLGTALIGWQVGSAIRKEFFEADVPQTPAQVTGLNWSVTVSNIQLRAIKKGDCPAEITGSCFTTGAGANAAPRNGFYLLFNESWPAASAHTGPGTATGQINVVGGGDCTSGQPDLASVLPARYSGKEVLLGAGACTLANPATGGPITGATVLAQWIFLRQRDVIGKVTDALDPGYRLQGAGTDTVVRHDTDVVNNVTTELHDHAGDYPHVIPFIAHQTDPDLQPEDPVKVTIPEPLAHETFKQYSADLRAAGLMGSIGKMVLPDSQVDHERSANEVVSTDPSAGSQVDPEDEVDVWINPAVIPGPQSGTGGDGGDPADGWTAPASPGIDLDPLRELGATACNTFPFGVPCYVIGAVGGLSGAGGAPDFHFAVGSFFGSNDLELDLAAVQPAVDIIRPLLLLMSFVGIVMWLSRRGAHDSGDGGDE
ncbi:MAG TPA: PASTA domain-containing protein, partial [Streptosporangiaceae bacterium]